MLRAPSMTDRPFAPPLSENEIQRAVFSHLRQRGAPGVFAFHPKNGGSHQRGRRAGINSGLGVVSGVPDIIILHKGKAYGLELKTSKGKVSPEQSEVMQRMLAAGADVAVAHGLDEALALLERWELVVGHSA